MLHRIGIAKGGVELPRSTQAAGGISTVTGSDVGSAPVPVTFLGLLKL